MFDPDAASPTHAGGSAPHRLLLETARQLGGSLEPAAIFARLRDSVCTAMACDGIIVSSLDRAAGLIRCEYAWVGGNLLDPATLPAITYHPEAAGMQTQVLRTGRPMLFSDVAERVQDPRGTYYEVDPDGSVRDLKDAPSTLSHSAVMAPLRLEGEVVGVVQVMSDRERAYTAADLELLEGVSLLLAVALENARLYARAQEEIEERRRAEEALRLADQRKDEFLATLGHELRNPLNPIRSATEVLRRRASDDPETRRWHDMIQRQVTHLTRLIDDLLDVSRITRGRLELRRVRVDLGDVLREAAETVAPLLQSRAQQLAVALPAEPVPLEADPVRLSQVFSNLLDNASKFAEEGGRIDVSAERLGERVAVAVRDQGRGIAAEDLAHVFDLFYQVSTPADDAHGGLGIGLTLVKRLVDMHGGVIAVESAGAGHGSTFTVTLPVAAAPPPAAAPAGAPASARTQVPAPARVLVADDNHDSANAMAMLLRLGGHEVEVAFDGEAALSVAERFRPEVMLVDIGMPRVDGYEVARRLRGETWGRTALLIAATGWGQDEDRHRTRQAGFDAHLTKPVDHGLLAELIAGFRAALRQG